MQLLIDFLPVVAFFVAYKLADIYVATAVLIVAVILQSAVQWMRKGKLSPMHLISAVLVLVFGGLTLAVQDKGFIMWKPTVVNWLFACGFLASQHRAFGDRPLVERLMTTVGTEIALTARQWRHLNLMWVCYFTVMGIANLIVFRNFDESTWVDFKLFGMLGMTLVFIVIQGIWVAARTRTREAGQ